MTTPLLSRIDRSMMRMFDMVAALALIVLTSPLMIIAAVGILMTSPGPVLYRAQRSGVNGVVFTMYKFRTMKVDDAKGPSITSPNDARIFPFGSFLRNTKIDELPQLFNILSGNMAFVGPRPEDPGIVDHHYDDRMLETLKVRPGLTCPGTLHYMKAFRTTVVDGDPERSYVDGVLRQKLEIDRRYIDEQTFASDICVLLKTAVAICTPSRGLR